MTQLRERTVIAASFVSLMILAWLATHVFLDAAIWFDAIVRDAIHQYASQPLTTFARALSEIGSPDSLAILGIGALAAFLTLGWRRDALLFAITLAGTLVLDATLKLGFHRTRPAAFFGTALPGSYSFPSGHALFSAALFCSLAILITPHVRSRAARAAVWTLAGLLAFAIGLSRIYLGVHYPSDVLGGYATAVLWLSLVWLVSRRVSHV